MELSNKKEVYDFSTSLDNEVISGKVSLVDNEVIEINANYKNITLSLNKIDGDYSVNIFGRVLSDVYVVSENIDDIIQDITNIVTQ